MKRNETGLRSRWRKNRRSGNVCLPIGYPINIKGSTCTGYQEAAGDGSGSSAENGVYEQS